MKPIVREVRKISRLIRKDCGEEGKLSFTSGFAVGFADAVSYISSWLKLNEEARRLCSPPMYLAMMFAKPEADCPSVKKYFDSLSEPPPYEL